MAQAALYLLTQVDVRRATQSDTSRKLIISSLIMPALKFITSEHSAGGGVMPVKFAQPRIEVPEPAFSTKGIDTDIFNGMGETERWTFAGAYLKKGPGHNKPVPARGIIEGAVVGWEPDESDPAEFQGCTHSFAEVTHYELHLDGKELFRADFYEGEIWVGGKHLTAPHIRALGA